MYSQFFSLKLFYHKFLVACFNNVLLCILFTPTKVSFRLQKWIGNVKKGAEQLLFEVNFTPIF